MYKSNSLQFDLKLKVGRLTFSTEYLWKLLQYEPLSVCNFIKVTISPRALDKHIGYYYNIYRVQTSDAYNISGN